MAPRVVADHVAVSQHPADQPGVGGDLAADHEERRGDAEALQLVEEVRREGRGPVVVGQRDPLPRRAAEDLGRTGRRAAGDRRVPDATGVGPAVRGAIPHMASPPQARGLCGVAIRSRAAGRGSRRGRATRGAREHAPAQRPGLQADDAGVDANHQRAGRRVSDRAGHGRGPDRQAPRAAGARHAEPARRTRHRFERRAQLSPAGGGQLVGIDAGVRADRQHEVALVLTERRAGQIQRRALRRVSVQAADLGRRGARGRREHRQDHPGDEQQPERRTEGHESAR